MKKYSIGWLIVIVAVVIIGYILSLLMGNGLEFLLCIGVMAIKEELRENSKALKKINKHLKNIEKLNRIDIVKESDKHEQ